MSKTSSIDIQVWKTRSGNYYPLAVGNIWYYQDDQKNQIVDLDEVTKNSLGAKST